MSALTTGAAVRQGIRGELLALFRLGAPMAATQFCIMAMGFLDVAMAGHYSSTDLAGVALGSNVLWPVMMFFAGLNMALTPIIAQLRGRGELAATGAKIRQGLWLAVFVSVLCILLVVNADPIFVWADADPAAAAVAGRYLSAVAWGVPAMLLYVTLRHSSEGLGRTLPPMIIAGTALPLNALLNYAFIYGEFGAPELGGEGCAWATAIVLWFELALMSLLLRARYFRETGVLSHLEPPSLTAFLSILKIGLPIAVTVFLEMTVFSVMTFLIASLGVTAIAAHSIAGNVGWATYVLPMSLGAAASIRVGYFVGANQFGAARHVAVVAFGVSLVYALIVSAILVLARHEIISVYTSDPAVAALASSVLLLIAIYQIVDDTQGTLVGALRGYKDTRIPMLFFILGYWAVSLPLGAVLGFGLLGFEPMGVIGFWTGMTIGLGLVALCMGWRLRSTSSNVERITRFSHM
ncbi:MAG: MATE family efflux transporter [Pseudomonadales bacterium]